MILYPPVCMCVFWFKSDNFVCTVVEKVGLKKGIKRNVKEFWSFFKGLKIPNSVNLLGLENVKI